MGYTVKRHGTVLGEYPTRLQALKALAEMDGATIWILLEREDDGDDDCPLYTLSLSQKLAHREWEIVASVYVRDGESLIETETRLYESYARNPGVLGQGTVLVQS